jgi:CRP/FNR family transcriptional regulator, anaerobic regulatory protein
MIPDLFSVPPGTEPRGVPDLMTAPSCIACAAIPKCLTGNLAKLDRVLPDAIIRGKRRVGRHECLYQSGDRQATLYQVRYGQFKVFARDPMGEQRVIGFRMAGDLIGLDAIATGLHQFGAVALEDSEVCEISYAALESAMTASPTVRRQFIQYLEHAAIMDATTATFMSTMRCEQRLGYFLLNLSSRYAELGYSNKSFRLSMSRADIGSYLGITPESVSRLIGRFKRNGWISVSHRNVEIADRDRLHMLLRTDPGIGLKTAFQKSAMEMTPIYRRR